MHGNPERKNSRSDIMRRFRQRFRSAMTICRGALIAKLYGDFSAESKTIILLSHHPRGYNIAQEYVAPRHRATQIEWKNRAILEEASH